MTDFSENILDLDQIKDATLEPPEILIKTDSTIKEKKKKPGRKSGQSQIHKGTYNPLLLNPNDKPKLSREERKALQLQELFEKMEQKEKKKEENSRKKRKMNSDKSPNLSVTHADSNQEDETEKPQENGDNASGKSEMSSPVREKTPIAKKSEPVKVNSKYFNLDFDLGGSRNLISFLYDYQKENTKKFSVPPQKKMETEGKLFKNQFQPPEGSLLSKAGSDQLNQLNTKLKHKNDKLFEHLKNYEQLHATKDLRHAFYNFDYQ